MEPANQRSPRVEACAFLPWVSCLGPAFLGLAAVLIVLAGCAAGNGTYSPGDTAGFFTGIWHGWIAPFALVGHVFDGDIRIYEPNNDGIWYDVGFYVAVISGFGSLSLRRTSKRQRRNVRDDDRRGQHS